MPVMTITVNTDLPKEHLARFKTAMSDMSTAMIEIGESLTKYYSSEPFVSKGTIYGSQWQPLASTTSASKHRRYPANEQQPLVASGAMQQGFGYEATPLSVAVRNKVQVGSYNLLSIHQHGTDTAGRGHHIHIPARTVMALNETLRQEIEVIVVEDVSKKIEATA
jgi:phage gpG-like protein